MLSDLAINDAEAFAKLAEVAKEKIECLEGKVKTFPFLA